MNRTLRSLATVVVSSAIAYTPLAAQQKVVTTADYDRAASQLAPSLVGLMTGGTATATWLQDDRFWYRTNSPAGPQVILVDPAKKSRVVCDAARSNCPGVPTAIDTTAGGRGGRGGGGVA